MSNDLAVELVGLFSAVLLAFIGWLVKMMHEIKRDARDINDAVNHRHRYTNGDGEMPPKLFDIALANHDKIRDVQEAVNDIQPKIDELHKWKSGYTGSELVDAKSVNELVKEVKRLRGQCDHHNDQLSTLNVNSDERSKARNKFFPGLNEPNSESDVESSDNMDLS